MQREEVKALGELAGSAAAGLAGQVREIHEGISQRVFKLVPGAGMVRTIHDGVSSGAHSASRALTGAIVRSGAGALSSRLPEGGPIDRSLAGRLAVGALNGMLGDALHRDASVLTLKMSLRRGGADVALDGPSLAAAFPDATPRLAVFLHGCARPTTPGSWRCATHPLRHAAPGRAWLHAALHPLQLGPSRVRERPRARAAPARGRQLVAGRDRRDRADRTLDGWPRGPQRLLLRRRGRVD